MAGWALPLADVRPEQLEVREAVLFGPDMEIPKPTEHVSRAMALDGNGARVRADAPVTSHLAASSVTPEGLHASQSWVLTELREIGIATMPRLVGRIPCHPETGRPVWSDSRVRSAVKELVELGLVSHVDDEGITDRGRACARYQAVQP